MPDPTTLGQRVFSSFAQLSTVAADLNAVSDDLGKAVADIDAALKKLNLGISVWVKVRTWDGDDSRGDLSFWSEDIGFAKINGKWGISLRRVDGDYNHPDDESAEEWLFGDAPRALRLQAIDKLPDLIEKLDKEAARTISEIQGKLPEVRAVAAAVNRSVHPATAGSKASGTKLSQIGTPDVGEAGWVSLRDAGRMASGEVQGPFGPLSKGAK